MITAINSAQPGLISQIQKTQQSRLQKNTKNKSDINFNGRILQLGGAALWVGLGITALIAPAQSLFINTSNIDDVAGFRAMLATCSFMISGVWAMLCSKAFN